MRVLVTGRDPLPAYVIVTCERLEGVGMDVLPLDQLATSASLL